MVDIDEGTININPINEMTMSLTGSISSLHDIPDIPEESAKLFRNVCKKAQYQHDLVALQRWYSLSATLSSFNCYYCPIFSISGYCRDISRYMKLTVILPTNQIASVFNISTEYHICPIRLPCDIFHLNFKTAIILYNYGCNLFMCINFCGWTKLCLGFHLELLDFKRTLLSIFPWEFWIL